MASDSSQPPPSFTARRFQEDDREAWDNFVANSVNGTFMHTRRFLSYHAPSRFTDHSLVLIDEKGKLRSVLPAAEVGTGRDRVLRSHPGSSYGGLIVRDEVSAASAQHMVNAIVRHSADEGFCAIWMRLTERVFHRRHCEELDAAYYRAGFTLDGRELSCAVRAEDVPSGQAPNSFRPSAKRAVKQSIAAGLTATISDDFARFWRILETNLAQHHHVHPTHSLDEILRLRELLGDRVELLAAFQDGAMTAGTILFHLNDVASHTMYMAQDYQFQSSRSLNLVLARAIDHCHRRGATWLNYGISSIPGSSGREMNDGLYRFKQSCGGKGVLRDLLVKRLD